MQNFEAFFFSAVELNGNANRPYVELAATLALRVEPEPARMKNQRMVERTAAAVW